MTFPPSNPFTLIGEEIAGAWNTEALAHIALAFGGEYLAYDGQVEEAEAVLDAFAYRVAAENHPAAVDAYAYRPPMEGRRALLVGNEAKGVRRRTRKRADALVEIPVISKNNNCLNVAAAAAILLYYLSLQEPLPFPGRTLAAIRKARPDLLLVGGPCPMELGSVIRSACAFGWERVFLHDRHAVWYEGDRIARSEGRGAARRGRNPIRVIPHTALLPTDYRRVVVLTTRSGIRPFSALSLIGKETLLVLEDELETSVVWNHAEFVPSEIVYASLPPVPPATYHYRQAASLALAEVARQLGRPDSDGIYLRSRKQRYRREVAEETAEGLYYLEDLACF